MYLFVPIVEWVDVPTVSLLKGRKVILDAERATVLLIKYITLQLVYSGIPL